MHAVAYLGPPGTFTEQAARAICAESGFSAEFLPFDTIPRAMGAVRASDAAAAVVPLENSVDGSVTATLDALVSGDLLVIARETVLPVRFHVLVRQGHEPEKIETIASHPVALAQVRDWIALNLPLAQTRPVNSTAAAAEAVLAGEADAAVCSPLAVEQHPGLEALATDIADVPDAATRFVLLTGAGELPEPTGADRTSIAVVAANQVGSLAEVLAVFAQRGINLSRIESRPTRDRLGIYRFFLDMDGHVADARVGDALASLRRTCYEVRFLGSYPKADQQPAVVVDSASEQAFADAQEWLRHVRSGG